MYLELLIPPSELVALLCHILFLLHPTTFTLSISPLNWTQFRQLQRTNTSGSYSRYWDSWSHTYSHVILPSCQSHFLSK